MNPFRLFIFIKLFFLMGCRTLVKQDSVDICANSQLPCLYKTEKVLLVTNQGEIKLELYGELAPLTVGNFIDLVEKGEYNNTIFNRVIREPSPFVVQGGDPFSKDPKTPVIDYGKGSFIDPRNGQVRFVPLEIKLKTENSPRYNQLITNPKEQSELQLVHQRGSLAMARSLRLNSGSSQFYMTLKALPELDGRYSVFGRIVEGMEVLDRIREGDLIINTKILKND